VEESDPVHEFFSEAHKASERAASLVRQLMIFSRTETPERVMLDLNTVISDVLKMLGRLVDENVSILTGLDASLRRVNANKGEIERVITNLVVNAKDAMPEGGTVRISTYNMSSSSSEPAALPGLPPGEYVCISVEDTGIGMSEDELGHIFEPFFNTKRNRPGGGTGLGLSVVYGIVEGLGGRIDVRSEPGSGSRFIVCLPAARHGRVCADADAGGPSPTRGDGEKVLLVEDEVLVRRAAVTVLSEHGYTVVEASCAGEAMEVFEREKDSVRVVISDFGLPDRNGLRLIDALLAERPALGAVLVSGYVDKKIDVEGLKARGIVFMNKPYDIEELLFVLAEMVKRE